MWKGGARPWERADTCRRAPHAKGVCARVKGALLVGPQADLAEANPGNALLQLRGNAGTHDLQLGTQVGPSHPQTPFFDPAPQQLLPLRAVAAAASAHWPPYA